MKQVRSNSLGGAWLKIMELIMGEGKECVYTDNKGDDFEVKEVLGLSVEIENPCFPDEIIEKYKNETEYKWMEDNFTKFDKVEALSDADSYATRFYNYMNQKNQIEWVIKRFREEKRLRSCTITTFEPLIDEKYIPCVSLLDFNIEDNKLHMYCYCRALDFGTKAYANLALLYKLQKKVADELNIETSDLTLFVKSAHLYKRNFERVGEILKDE